MTNDYAIERAVLKVAAITTLIIGFALLTFSSQLVQLFDGGTQPSRHFAIYLGTALVGFAVTNWLYSRSHDLAAILPAIYGNLTSLAVATVIDIVSLIISPVNKIVWPILFLHLIFTSAFTYCLWNIRRSN